MRLCWATLKPESLGRVSARTWNSWFCEVMWTSPVSTSLTGWLPPWWPKGRRSGPRRPGREAGGRGRSPGSARGRPAPPSPPPGARAAPGRRGRWREDAVRAVVHDRRRVAVGGSTSSCAPAARSDRRMLCRRRSRPPRSSGRRGSVDAARRTPVLQGLVPLERLGAGGRRHQVLLLDRGHHPGPGHQASTTSARRGVARVVRTLEAGHHRPAGAGAAEVAGQAAGVDAGDGRDP